MQEIQRMAEPSRFNRPVRTRTVMKVRTGTEFDVERLRLAEQKRVRKGAKRREDAAATAAGYYRALEAEA